MSGKPPEYNGEPIKRAASASPQQASRIPVPIAPKGLQQRVDTQLGLHSVAVSSVRGPQVTSGMEQSTARASGVAPPKKKKEPGALTGKSVVVLKPSDVIVRDGTVFMPNTIEMAQLKKAEKGQFKTNVQISSMMSEMDIEKILVETFPFLKCQRLYCAGAADNRTRLDFRGERRIWNGRFIKQNIKGNSALYIYAEEDSTVARQIAEASGIGNQSLSASGKSNKSIKQPAACSNTGAHLGSVRTVTETATATITTPLVRLISSPSVALVNQRTQNAIPKSSVCYTQIPTHSGEQSSLRCSDEGYEHPSKKRKTAQNVSKHSKPNAVNRFRRKRSHSMTSSNSVPMSVSCPVVSDQQSLEQPMSPNTGAITDTSKLAAQMENLRFGEKAGSSVKRVDNGADSRHDSQSKPLPTEEIIELGGHPHNGWSLRVPSCSFTGEQSTFPGQERLDDLYQDRVGVLDPMGTTPSSISDLNSDASSLNSWITAIIQDNLTRELNIDVFSNFSESTDFDDSQLEIGGSREDVRVLQTTPWCDEDNQRPATHPITVPPPCHPSAPPLNMELNFVEEHQPQGNNTVQMPAASIILQGTAPDEYGNNSDPSYTGIGSGYDSTSSGLGNSLDPTSTETTENNTVLNSSEDDLATESRTKISIDPPEVDMQGGGRCRIKITPELSSEVQSVRLEVGLGTMHLSKDGEHYEGSPIPPSDKPGWHLAVIWSQSDKRIGDAWLYYRTKFETALAIVLLSVEEDPSKYPTVFEGLADTMRGQVSTISGETRNCGRLESTRTVQVLLSLLYKAAEFGAQRFVKMLLNSPFGRSIFHEYKKSALLPEAIARNHGHEHTALYLEGITNRFSQEITPTDLGRIDWSRFPATCNAREDGVCESPQPDGINDSDSSYLGDVESLSCDSAGPMSDSEDDLSEMFSKVSVKENHIQEEETTAGKDENEITHRPSGDVSGAQLGEKETQESNVSLKESINKDQMSGKPVTTSSDHMLFFENKGKFSRKEIAVNRRKKAIKLVKGEHRIFRIREHFNCKFPDLTKIRSAHQPIIWQPLTINTESINRFFSTMEDRWRIQLQHQQLLERIATSLRSMPFHAMHSDPWKGTLPFTLSMPAVKVETTIAQALKSLSTDAGLSTLSDNTTRAACEPFDSPLPSNNSIPSDVVALTSVYRPSGKILLSFVSDRNGFLPPESWFEDEDCELLMECWKWRRCKNNFLAQKRIEIKDQPELLGQNSANNLKAHFLRPPVFQVISIGHAVEKDRLRLVQGEVKDLVKDYTVFKSQLNLQSKQVAEFEEKFDIPKDQEGRLNEYELIDAQYEKLRALKNRREEMRKALERRVSFEEKSSMRVQAQEQRVHRLEQSHSETAGKLEEVLRKLNSLKTQMDKPGASSVKPAFDVHAQHEMPKALKNRYEEMRKAYERFVPLEQQARYRPEQSLRTIMDELGASSVKPGFDLKTCRSKLQDHAQDEKLKALKNRREEMRKASERRVPFESKLSMWLQARRQQMVYRLEQSHSETSGKVKEFVQELKSLKTQMDKPACAKRRLPSCKKRRELWRETHTPLWLLIGRIIFLTCEKTSFAIMIGRILFFHV